MLALGSLGDGDDPEPVLPLAASLRGDTAPGQEAREGVTPILAAGAHGSNGAGIGQAGDPAFTLDTTGAAGIAQTAPTLSARTRGGGGLGTDFDCDGGLVAAVSSGRGWWDESDVGATLRAQESPTKADRLIASTGDIAHCLNADGMGRQDYETETLVTHTLRGDGFDASEAGTGRGTPLVPVAFDTTQITSAANYSNPKPGDPCHPLAAGAHPPAIAFDWQKGDGGADDSFRGKSRSWITRAGDYTGALGATKRDGVAAGSAIRRLTPTECARLQGFPDDHCAIVYRGKPAADGPMYKSLGNSMAVPVVRWILERLERVDRGQIDGQTSQGPNGQAARPRVQESDGLPHVRRET